MKAYHEDLEVAYNLPQHIYGRHRDAFLRVLDLYRISEIVQTAGRREPKATTRTAKYYANINETYSLSPS